MKKLKGNKYRGLKYLIFFLIFFGRRNYSVVGIIVLILIIKVIYEIIAHYKSKESSVENGPARREATDSLPTRAYTSEDLKIQDKLWALKELRDDGFISESKYKRKRLKLLRKKRL